MPEFKELLSYKDIVISRGKTIVLSDVNVNLHNAELLFILGASGSGKSSFLKTIYGAMELSGQQAKVLGFDLLKVKANELQYLRRQLGIVFQDYKIFEKQTVFENLNYFLKSIGINDRKRIEVMLEKVGLIEYAEKRGYQLSGGEKQRLSVARALVHKPKLIIADEPTGNLNKSLGIEIFKLLRDLALEQGSSIIAATHDEALTNIFAARVFMCEDGKLNRV